MAVTLSPVAGVAGQFFDNNGNPLVGGKLYAYIAGTTTPQASYASAAGGTAHANPIVLDAGGRVPGGEIWLTDGLQYKFVLKTLTDTLIGTYDNVVGINSNFVNFTNQQEIQTATAGQTVFTLATVTYSPGTNSLSVFVDGVNQYGPGATYAYLETDSTTITFLTGLHVGASVKFTTSQLNSGASAVTADTISYTPTGTGAVATTVQAKLRESVSVLDFGAVGNGVADDTAALQLALNAVVANGQELYFPAGTYKISTTLTASGTFRMRGVPSSTYQDYANDIAQWNPSYAGKASIIQFAAGSHGAILNSGNHSIEGMVFRCGQVRTSADVFLQDRSLLGEYINCKFENLGNVFGDDTANAFGPQFVRGCRFFSCGTIAAGVVVDATFTGNVFTSCGTVFSLSPGSGYVSIIGNRFEYCTQAFYSFQGRECIFNNNLIDSCFATGVRLNTVVGMSLIGNLFWRNGYNGDATGRSHIQITGVCTGTTIVGNNFQYGEQDGGGNPRPKYVLELEACAGSAIQFKANNTLDGYTAGFVIDTYGSSGACLDADRFDLTPGGFNPNTGSDTIGDILDFLNSSCLSGTYPHVYIYENRKVNGYSKYAAKLFLTSGNSTAITLDLSAGGMTFDRLNNVSIDGNTFTDKSGVTYGSAIPNGYLQQGTWSVGKAIYNEVPVSGAYIGAVKTATGSPDTWKNFGAIA